MLTAFMPYTLEHIKDHKRNSSGTQHHSRSAIVPSLYCFVHGERKNGRKKERKEQSSNKTVKYEERLQKE